jgi:hypothetical protein
MRKLLLFCFGMIVGGGIVCFAFSYHVVRTNNGVVLIPKKPAGLGHQYVDVRNWKPSDWQAHPELAEAIMAHGRGDLIGPSPHELLRELGHKLGDAQRADDELRTE